MTTIFINGFGQDFQVRERTVEQKHNRSLYLAYANMAVGISAAKEAGMTVTEYAKFVGDQFKLSWNKEAGFAGFVKGTLNNYETSRRTQDTPIKIVEQSENKVVLECKIDYKRLFNNGPVFGTTYEEFSLCWSIVHSQIAEYLGATYKQEELDDDIIRVTILKSM